MKNLLEIGIIFRGFILCNYHYEEEVNKKDNYNDLRGPFLASINHFVSQAFNNNPLEYLESGKHMFIFKVGEIKAKDSPKHQKEPVILYGLFLSHVACYMLHDFLIYPQGKS